MPSDSETYKPAETKPDVFSLEGLITWLETQDSATEYNYMCNGDCLLHRYFRASGLNMPVGEGVGGDVFRETGGEYRPLPFHFVDIAASRPHTYGAALERARKAVR